jgi:hypothetical protein
MERNFRAILLLRDFATNVHQQEKELIKKVVSAEQNSSLSIIILLSALCFHRYVLYTSFLFDISQLRCKISESGTISAFGKSKHTLTHNQNYEHYFLCNELYKKNASVCLNLFLIYLSSAWPFSLTQCLVHFKILRSLSLV